MNLVDKIQKLNNCPALFKDKEIYRYFIDGSECSHKIKGNCNTYHTLRNRRLAYGNIQTNMEKN